MEFKYTVGPSSLTLNVESPAGVDDTEVIANFASFANVSALAAAQNKSAQFSRLLESFLSEVHTYLMPQSNFEGIPKTIEEMEFVMDKLAEARKKQQEGK